MQLHDDVVLLHDIVFRHTGRCTIKGRSVPSLLQTRDSVLCFVCKMHWFVGIWRLILRISIFWYVLDFKLLCFIFFGNFFIFISKNYYHHFEPHDNFLSIALLKFEIIWKLTILDNLSFRGYLKRSLQDMEFWAVFKLRKLFFALTYSAPTSYSSGLHK